LGLLTKIFGNAEGGANASSEPEAAEQSSDAGVGTEDPVISAYPKSDSSNSGVRPAVETPPQRRDPTRSGVGGRRPEHPRMYLRPSAATVDPAVPGSTRRPQIAVRAGTRERPAPPPPRRSGSERAMPDRSVTERAVAERVRGAKARERSAEPSSVPSTLPPASRPRNAMVVSPVSLTPEELQLPPGARQKMPTLVGLGAALETPPLPLVAPVASRAPAPSRTSTSGHFPSSHSSSSGLAHAGLAHAGLPQEASKSSNGVAPKNVHGGTSQNGAAQSNAAQSNAVQGNAAQSNAVQGNAAQSNAAQSRVPQSSTAQSSAPHNGVSQSNGTSSIPAAPGSAASSSAGSSVSLTVSPASSASVSHVGTPGTLGPEVSVPPGDASNPRTSKRGTSRAGEPQLANPPSSMAEASAAGSSLAGSSLAGSSPAEASVGDGEEPSNDPPGERTPFDALRPPPEDELPDDLSAPVQLLADFALKLSLGPVSRAWVPEVRRVAEALLSTGKHRHETALAALSARLLSLLPNTEPDAPSRAAEPGSIAGEQRDQILHELSRLAGVLPEWPTSARDLTDEARRRETRVMRELLVMVDGFRRDQRARIEEHLRLEDLAAMTPAAIAEEFEASLERADELSTMLAEYHQSRRMRAPDLGNVIALGRAIEELASKNRDFDDCDPDQKAAQRVLRLERRRALSAVNVLLAERGEFEWMDQLEPLSMGERVERLEHWLENIRFEGDTLELGSERVS
jgi:hypothetical protein